MKKNLQKTVFSEQIREQLMEDILNGRLQPGEKLSEIALANEFNVSQAPVREALKSLEVLGLVTSEPYKGTIVRTSSEQAMKEYFQVRSALEGLAGRLAAENATDEEIRVMEKLVTDMMEADGKGEKELRTELNCDFHNALIDSSHNGMLISVCRSLRLGSWSKITAKYTRMSDKDITERHTEIIDYLKAHDADGAENALQEHVHQSFEMFTHGAAVIAAEETGQNA